MGRILPAYSKLFRFNYPIHFKAAVGHLFTKGAPRMASSSFSPPDSVKGMTILDKVAFEKIVTIPCLVLPVQALSRAMPLVKPFLLKMPNLKNPKPLGSKDSNPDAVSVDGFNGDEVSKVAILDPKLVNESNGFNTEVIDKLEKAGVSDTSVRKAEFKLTFDNWNANEILRAIVPDDLEAVKSYSLIGHIVHLNLRSELLPFKKIIGDVFLDKIKQARTVVNKTDNIDNTYRNFEMEILCGDSDMMAKVKENKCLFEFDFSSVYWNPRLCSEHERIVDKLQKGDVLFDIFAGVGPFSIPAAKKGCHVWANDLNPHSVKWLKHNASLNKIKGSLNVSNKDAAAFIKHDFKNTLGELKQEVDRTIHVTMNLPALAVDFLPHFKGLFDSSTSLDTIPTPTVYVYMFCKGAEDSFAAAKETVERSLGMKLEEEIKDVAFVRNVAPNKDMMRVTLSLSERILHSPLEKRMADGTAEENPAKKVCV